MKYLVTGGAGFIGSHLTDHLIAEGHQVAVVDNLQSGFREQVNACACFYQLDIRENAPLTELFQELKPDGVFHLAAIARTPWCIDDPLLASSVNGHGTVCVLEAARRAKVQRSVLASSNVIYAAMTPYRATKDHVNDWAQVYRETYGMSVQSLVFSNVYGTRQSELGPSPNVFAALRKSIREKGYAEVTGDGEQTRDFTHVSDIVRGIIATMQSDCLVPPIDLCTGSQVSINYVVKELFRAECRYIPERPGDAKHIIQHPERAREILGWTAKVSIWDGIKDVL